MTANEENRKYQAEERRIEFSFPMLILRTKRFSGVFDKLGRLRASRYLAWVFLGLVPFVAGIAIYLIATSLVNVLMNPSVVGEVARDLGAGAILLLPGINPMLPIVYGWLAIIVAIVLHEGAHGIIARNNGLTVKSSGLLFFLVIPIGAFVDVDEEQIKVAKSRASLKVMAAGVGANVIVGLSCLLCMLLIVGSLSPAVTGVYVADVVDGMPAKTAGLLAKDTLVSVDNVTVKNTTDLRVILDGKAAGDLIHVTVARGEKWQDRYTTTVNLTSSENRTVMGISTYDLMTQERLDFYQNFSLGTLSMYLIPPTLYSGFVPFSDFLTPFYSSAIPFWSELANMLFWIWFVNFNLAIFNALPIYPLDGGRIFNITLKRFGRNLSEKAVYRITLAVTAVCVILVVSGTVLPFLL